MDVPAVINRYIDPSKIDVDEKCLEYGKVYLGERVEGGYELRGFELVERERDFSEGVEIVISKNLKFDNFDVLGIHILVDTSLSEEAASAIGSLIGEVLSKIKGLEYKFRKENVVIKLSDELKSESVFECIGKMIFLSFKKIPAVSRLRVRLILEKEEFEKIRKKSREIHLRRNELFKKKDEEVDRFFACTSCQCYLPSHGCVISPERPSPCGTTWVEAKAAEELGIVQYYRAALKGRRKNSEYEEINNTLRKLSEGKIERVSLHSVLKNPPPTGLYSELIIFYDPERDAFGIIDRNFKERTPIGLTFSEMERIIIGQQVEGFTGSSFSYLKSERFLADEGGWERVYWASPKVYDYLKTFLPSEILSGIETIQE